MFNKIAAKVQFYFYATKLFHLFIFSPTNYAIFLIDLQKQIRNLAYSKKSCNFAPKRKNMEDNYKIPFINACIRGMGMRFSIPVKNAYLYLKRFQGIDFLIEFYNTLHLQSIDDTVDDLVLICKKNGGALT